MHCNISCILFIYGKLIVYGKFFASPYSRFLSSRYKAWSENILIKKLNFELVFKFVGKNTPSMKNTIFGKIQIIKFFTIPKISYRTNIVKLSSKRLKMLITLFFKFVWNGKDKVKRAAVINNYKMGGLRITRLRIIHLLSYINSQRIVH